VAVAVVLWLDFLDDGNAPIGQRSRWMGGGPGPRPFPDYARFAHREYGHRVGVFRLLDLLDRHGCPVAAAVDGMTARTYPALMTELTNRPVEVLAHGEAVTRMITSAMSEDEERDAIERSLAALTPYAGRPRGWLGPEYGQSERTPRLLAEAGVEYLCDWGNDEHPYRLQTDGGEELWVLPSAVGYDDSLVMEHRKMSPRGYYAMVGEGIRELVADAARTGRRSLVLNLRPYLSGQPFRADHLDELLTAVAAMGDVWLTTPGAIVDAAREGAGEPQDIVTGPARR
jgi:peptidoglycan/xylan/chitin deacetylase (PgdA/CDA1 family)